MRGIRLAAMFLVLKGPVTRLTLRNGFPFDSNAERQEQEDMQRFLTSPEE